MRAIITLCALLALAGTAHAQGLTWTTAAELYADNTEFFTPYRVGETILGGQFRSYMRMHTGARTEINIGIFGDHRSGSDRFIHPFRPILSFRFQDENSTGVLGTLVPERRHGFIEPLQSSLLELTRPIEYGAQWVERRRYWYADLFLNWQRLNVQSHREVFDAGVVAGVRPVRFLTVEAQFHGTHHGGQLFDAGKPVTNNIVTAIGAIAADSVRWLHRVSLAAYRLKSSGFIEAPQVAGVPVEGSGTYLRAGITPAGWVELFAIRWTGKDFVSEEGDNNYNSTGSEPTFYRSNREYWEVGALRRTPIEGDVTLDAELRFHQIDGGVKSIGFFDSRWEVSYRMVVRAPFELVLR